MSVPLPPVAAATDGIAAATAMTAAAARAAGAAAPAPSLPPLLLPLLRSPPPLLLPLQTPQFAALCPRCIHSPAGADRPRTPSLPDCEVWGPCPPNAAGGGRTAKHDTCSIALRNSRSTLVKS